MNKKLIAIAVAAGMAAPMAANAAPQVYGKLLAEYVMHDEDGTDSSGLEDNGIGRIGVKGSEDLGGGLSAVYRASWQIDTEANDGLEGRYSFVGLKGNFGTFTFGTNSSPYKDTNLDPFNATALQARGNVAQSKLDVTYNDGTDDVDVSNGGFGHHGFVDNSLKYNNQFGPVKFGLLYGMYSDDDDTTNGSEAEDAYSLAAEVPAGPVNIVVAQSSIGAPSAAPVTLDDMTATKIAAEFKTGPWTFTAQSESIEGRNFTQGAAGEEDFMYVAASFKMGKNLIYARVGERDRDGNANDHDNVALNVMHKFSKKTRVFAGYNSIDSETDSDDDDRLVVGMRVDF